MNAIPIDNLIGSMPCSQADREQMPSALRPHLVALYTKRYTFDDQLQPLGQQVNPLRGRLAQTFATSSKPPASDSPFKMRKPRSSSGKRGGYKGYLDSVPKLLQPTEMRIVLPPSRSCGHMSGSDLTPNPTHQVPELPPIDMEVTHVLLHQAI